MSFRARPAKGCPIHSTSCSSTAPSRTHRAELGTQRLLPHPAWTELVCKHAIQNLPTYCMGSCLVGTEETPNRRKEHLCCIFQRKLWDWFGTVCASPFIWEPQPQVPSSSHPQTYMSECCYWHVCWRYRLRSFFHSGFARADVPDWWPSHWRRSVSLSFQKCCPWLGPG